MNTKKIISFFDYKPKQPRMISLGFAPQPQPAKVISLELARLNKRRRYY